MKDEEIKELSHQYKRLLGIKENILMYIRRKKQLEETPEVREYLNTCARIDAGKGYDYYGVEQLSDDQILDKIINDTYIEGDNKIYVCIDEDIIQKFMVFKNLETKMICSVRYQDLDSFDSENHVIYPSESHNKEKFYETIRRNYYRKIAEDGFESNAKNTIIESAHEFKRSQKPKFLK